MILTDAAKIRIPARSPVNRRKKSSRACVHDLLKGIAVPALVVAPHVPCALYSTVL